jgi:hypothetical protein
MGAMAELPLAEIERLLTLYRKYDGTCIFLIPCKRRALAGGAVRRLPAGIHRAAAPQGGPRCLT